MNINKIFSVNVTKTRSKTNGWVTHNFVWIKTLYRLEAVPESQSLES